MPTIRGEERREKRRELRGSGGFGGPFGVESGRISALCGFGGRLIAYVFVGSVLYRLPISELFMSVEKSGGSSAREPWKVCRGPANWFTFRCPDGIEVRQDQTVLELLWYVASAGSSLSQCEASSLRSLMSVVAWWNESEPADGLSKQSRSAPDPTLLFPRVSSVRVQRPLRMALANEVWSGKSSCPVAVNWLSRMFSRVRSYSWRLWVFRQGHLTIVATTQSTAGEELSREQIMVCERLLMTMEVAETPAWPPDVFQQHVLALARQHYPLLSATARGFALRLGQSEISLSNLYRVYLQQPEHFRRIVLPGLTAMVRLQELGPDQLAPAFSKVQEKILPMLAPDDEQCSDGRVRQPWVGGLSIGYVIDEADSYRYIQERMLGDWGVSLDELHEVSLQNLRTWSEDHPLEVTVVGSEEQPRMLMPVSPDAYNCSRVLDQGFYSRLRGMFGTQLVLGMPNRDFFVAVSLRQPDLIQHVRDRVDEDFQTMRYPLTRCLLLLSPDGVSEFPDDTTL